MAPWGRRSFVEAFIPLLCLVAVTALLWLSVLRGHTRGRPAVGTWRTAGVVVLGAAGAVAVPIVVAAVLNW